LSVGVPYKANVFVPMGEFIQEYNEQAEGILTVTPEFEEAVMQPLTRVLAKKGAGMSDEQFLMFMFGQDVLQKGFQFKQMKDQTRSILQFAKDQTAAARVGTGRVVSMKGAAAAETPVMQPTPAPVVSMEPQNLTLQEQALGRVIVQPQPAATGTDGAAVQTNLPVYGDTTKLSNIDKVFEQELKEKNQREKVRKKLLANGGLPKARSKKSSTPRAPKPRRSQANGAAPQQV
jgi:hypothetical protein